jgi:hypothetical protein
MPRPSALNLGVSMSCLGAQNLGFPCRAQIWGFHVAQNLGFRPNAQNFEFPCGAQNLGIPPSAQTWGFHAAPKIWGFHPAPKFGVSMWRPKFGVPMRRPKFGVSTQCAKFGASMSCQKFGVSTRCLKFGVSTRCLKFRASMLCQKFGVSTQRLKFGGSARRRKKIGVSMSRLKFGVSARRKKFWGLQVAPKPGETWGFHPAPKIWASMSRPKFGVSTRRPKFGASAGRKICWGLQVAPKPGETWGFYVAPRRQSRGKLGVSMWHPDRNRRRPSLGNLGFPSRATTETDGAQAWEAWGFHVAPLMEPRVSAFYGTRETRGTWDFHDDANQLASLGNLGCFETAAQVWGTRCFHVAAHPESPESLWNFRFPCRGAMKSHQSLGNSGCPFFGAMKIATQVSGHTRGFHFVSQQKLLPKSGKRGVRTYGSVSPHQCEVRTL